ncbi:MAG: hypothetical protein M1840_001223 [Geoglossum simile]|nr:MAG: hypothetical protein M1840_001223 [Geoglossum simile]
MVQLFYRIKPNAPEKLTKSTKSTKPSKPAKSSKSSESSKPSKPSKPSSLEVVSSYNLHKVHIPYIGKDGTSLYQSRSASKKAVILWESLLTLAKQKQQQQQQLQKIQTISQNASQGTNRQRVEAYQWLIMKEEEKGEDRDEGEDKDNDNDNKDDDKDNNEDLQLARGVLGASDKFKNHRMQQVLQRAANDVQSAYSDDITTSDIQDHLENVVQNAQLKVDYPIEVLTKRRSLSDTTKDNFDLSDIEDKLAQDLNILGNREPISILQRTAFIHAATRQTIQKVHDLDDFGLIKAGCILEMVEAARGQHP